MKLLLFSDLHCNERAARRLVERAEKADVVVGAGDSANARRGIEICINVLKDIKRPTILVPGNNESYDELVEACRGWPESHVLHGQCVQIAGVFFFGIGGGIPVTPFGSWSFDFTESHAATLLEPCPSCSILVTHSPPRGVVDLSSSGRHLGSETIRDVVLSKSPRLVVCGHIHGSAGQQATLGESVVINAGPDGVEWEL